MPSKMEDILGLGPVDSERRVPGTYETEGREYRYVSCGGDEDLAALFKRVVREIEPPLATHGGVINEGCKVTLPSGGCYFAVSYKGDIEGWRQQIEQGAFQLGLSIARPTEQSLVFKDGDEVLLSDCNFQFF